MYRVSILIPTFNCAQFLPCALESAINQTYQNREIIVIDDGSTDKTPEILKSYPTIKTIYQDNKGVCAARNNGISQATGDYIATLDADDEWLMDRLEIMMNYLKANPRLVGAFSNFYLMHQNGKIIRTRYKEKQNLATGDQYKNLLYRSIPHVMMIMRKDAILNAGGYDETLKRSGDYDLHLRIARDGGKWGYINIPLAKYRLTDNSLSRFYDRDYHLIAATIFNKHNNYLGHKKTNYYIQNHMGYYRWYMFYRALKSLNPIAIIKHAIIAFRSPMYMPKAVIEYIKYFIQ